MKLVGKIEDLGLGEILQIISFSQKSGILWLNSLKRVGSIVFKNGLIIRATSSAFNVGVGDYLVQSGAIDSASLASAKSAQLESGYASSIGAIVVANGLVEAPAVDDAAKKLIEKMVVSFFFWHDGTFVFELKDFQETPEQLKGDSLQHTLSHGLNPQFVAMEGSRVHDESMRAGVIPDDIPVGEAGGGSSPAQQMVQSVSSGDDMEVIEKAEEFQVITPELLKELEGEKLFMDLENEKPVMIQESKGLRLLKEMLEELSRPLTLGEVVLLILRFSSEVINRAVVFAIKQGNIVGMGQFGVELVGKNADMQIRKMKISLSEESIIREAIERKDKVVKKLDGSASDQYIIEQLGGLVPPESYVNPIVVRGKVAFILYADNAPSGQKVGDTSSLEIFLAQTRIVLERMVLQKKLANQQSPQDEGADEGMAL